MSESRARLGASGRLTFELVTRDNEWEVRELLRNTAVQGWISLSYEREPDYLLGASVEGAAHQTVIAREPRTGQLVGTFSRSVRPAWINGEVRQLGYLGLLRMDARFRGRTRYLRDGYEACRRFLHDPAGTPFYATSIVESNVVARRVLTAGLPGLPTYRELDRFSTLALPIRLRRLPPPAGVTIQSATSGELAAIARCLQRNYARYQCAPFWSAADLCSTERCRGLEPGDFFLALRDGGVIGCLALWDQRAFKQHVVHGYSPTLRRWRRAINRVAPLLSLPSLPDIGQPLQQASLSHGAVDNDDPAVLCALVAAGLNEACRRQIPLATLGLSTRHPALATVKSTFRHLEYRSILYLVHWQDGEHAAAALDERPAHLEAATL